MRLMHGLVVAIVCSGFTPSPLLAASRGHAAPPPVAPNHAVVPVHPAVHASKPAHVHPAAAVLPKTVVSNPALVARLRPLLPPGTSVTSAAAGFKNRGQFIAALHVSRNLNIPFALLKAEMTGPDHVKLGQAIQDLRPGVHAKTEAKIAEREAHDDLKASKHLPRIAKPKPSTDDRDKDDR